MLFSHPELPVAVAADIASASAAVLLGFSGLTGGILHYGAVLARLPDSDVESITAIGFFLGLTFGVATLALEVLL